MPESNRIEYKQEIMRIFKDLDLVEQLGSGVPRILKYYKKNCFLFSENFIRMTFPSQETVVETVIETVVETVVETEQKIIEILSKNNKASAKIMGEKLEVSQRTIQRHLKSMVSKGILKREGTAKGGNWIILNKHS